MTEAEKREILAKAKDFLERKLLIIIKGIQKDLVNYQLFNRILF